MVRHFQRPQRDSQTESWSVLATYNVAILCAASTQWPSRLHDWRSIYITHATSWLSDCRQYRVNAFKMPSFYSILCPYTVLNQHSSFDKLFVCSVRCGLVTTARSYNRRSFVFCDRGSIAENETLNIAFFSLFYIYTRWPRVHFWSRRSVEIIRFYDKTVVKRSRTFY